MANHLDRDVGSPVIFIVSVGAIQILGILAMILTGVWMGKYLGGFAWDGSGLEFNYHPLCMVISMVFLYSEGKIFNFCTSMFQYIMQFGSTAWPTETSS